jgi:hypothetical protein
VARQCLCRTSQSRGTLAELLELIWIHHIIKGINTFKDDSVIVLLSNDYKSR